MDNAIPTTQSLAIDPRHARTWYRCNPPPVQRIDAATLSVRVARDRGITEDDALWYMELCRNQGEPLSIDEEIFQDHPPLAAIATAL